MPGKHNKSSRKPSILTILIILDVSMIAVIFTLLLIFFNTTVSKLIIDTASESMTSRSLRVSRNLIEAYDYIAEKPDMQTGLILSRVHMNILGHALNELEYDDSTALLLLDSGSVIGGTRSSRDLIIDETEIGEFSRVDDEGRRIAPAQLKDELCCSESEAALMSFRFSGREYIGTVQYVEYENRELLLILGDRAVDFYSRLHSVRNVFLLFIGVSLSLILLIKVINTRAAAGEILQIRNMMQEQGDQIQREGLVTTAEVPDNYEFLDTEDLAGSFGYLNGRIENLGGIIEGIADRDLFIAALRDDESVLSPHEESMAVLFLDVQGFTGISEKHGSAAMNIINRIWDLVQNEIEARGGKLNKFMGDACLVIFPENGSDTPSKRAVESAVALYENVEELREHLQTDFEFRIGLDYGRIVYGKTGSERKYELGVIGDPVNTAARFESLNKQYGTRLLLSGEIIENAGPEVFGRYSGFRVDIARPKGKRKAKQIYSLISRDGNAAFCRFIGLEQQHDPRLLKLHKDFIDACEAKLELWLSDRAAAGRVWGGLAYNWALLDSKYGLSVAGMFVERFVTPENYLEYRRDPVEWMARRNIKVAEPDEGWLDTGYYELRK